MSLLVLHSEVVFVVCIKRQGQHQTTKRYRRFIFVLWNKTPTYSKYYCILNTVVQKKTLNRKCRFCTMNTVYKIDV